MQKEFTICLFSKEGKQVNMEVRQKNQHITKRKVKTWTTEQDNKLLELYQEYPKKWSDIASLMKERNQNQCLHRYRRLCQFGKGHKIWSSEEDETIKKLIKKYGKNWKLLSEIMGSKNGKQIRERFINKLDPKIKKDEWNEDQDRKILELFSKIGSKWSEISKYLPGRPENKIKNRFYSFIQKNYDIKFKQLDNNDTAGKKVEIKAEDVIKGEQKEERPLSEILADKQNEDIDPREEVKRSQERIFSKFQIPSINEIEFDIKNENFMSQNMLEPVMREEEWKSHKDYQSIIELNSDMYFKYHA